MSPEFMREFEKTLLDFTPNEVYAMRVMDAVANEGPHPNPQEFAVN